MSCGSGTSEGLSRHSLVSSCEATSGQQGPQLWPILKPSVRSRSRGSWRTGPYEEQGVGPGRLSFVRVGRRAMEAVKFGALHGKWTESSLPTTTQGWCGCRVLA